MNFEEVRDYKGPILDKDLSARAAYITLNNTQAVHRTKVLHLDDSGDFVIMADLSERGNILGIEVMW